MAAINDEKRTAERLRNYARWYAASRGFQFGPGADAEMDQLAEHAAREIYSRSSSPAEQELDARRAEGAFSILVDEMINAADSLLPPGPPGVIGERTLERARALLCPLWPIC